MACGSIRSGIKAGGWVLTGRKALRRQPSSPRHRPSLLEQEELGPKSRRGQKAGAAVSLSAPGRGCLRRRPRAVQCQVIFSLVAATGRCRGEPLLAGGHRVANIPLLGSGGPGKARHTAGPGDGAGEPERPANE